MTDLGSARLMLVGCGKMGGALLAGWLKRGLKPESTVVIEPHESVQAELAAKGVTVVGDLESAGKGPFDVIVLAVKPQTMGDVLPPYRAFVSDKTAFLSIAAGKTIDYFKSILGNEARIIRSMPNTPAAIGHGMTVACADEKVSANQRVLAETLLSAVGKVGWVEDEQRMDAVTAVSGSGPAYVFLLAEAMTKAGIKAGLAPDVSEMLARQTVAGAGALLVASTESAEQLRINVTSPGGTTAAALEILMQSGGVEDLMVEAIRQATRRSKELAG